MVLSKKILAQTSRLEFFSLQEKQRKIKMKMRIMPL